MIGLVLFTQILLAFVIIVILREVIPLEYQFDHEVLIRWMPVCLFLLVPILINFFGWFLLHFNHGEEKFSFGILLLPRGIQLIRVWKNAPPTFSEEAGTICFGKGI